MDLKTAGIVSAALFCSSRQGKFYVQTKNDGTYPWCGVRDNYTLPKEIDVTIGKDGKLPFEKIFGKK